MSIFTKFFVLIFSHLFLNYKFYLKICCRNQHLDLNAQVQSQASPFVDYDPENVEIDLENWMGKLPLHLTRIPLIYVAIPGKLLL